jgi:hypothetical protein
LGNARGCTSEEKNDHHDYKMKDEAGNSRVLDEIAEKKDLGVWITNDLKLSLQCTKAAN